MLHGYIIQMIHFYKKMKPVGLIYFELLHYLRTEDRYDEPKGYDIAICENINWYRLSHFPSKTRLDFTEKDTGELICNECGLVVSNISCDHCWLSAETKILIGQVVDYDVLCNKCMTIITDCIFCKFGLSYRSSYEFKLGERTKIIEMWSDLYWRALIDRK